MKPIPTTTAHALATPASLKPFLICFSHLRWGFVWQRPQHLMVRAARDYRVIILEDNPVLARTDAPRLDITQGPGAIKIAAFVLPEGSSPMQITRAKRQLLERLMGEVGADGWPLVTWYYTPMALAYSDHLEPDLTVYDCMDELTGFRFAPKMLRRRERQLFQRADVVFTGGMSLYEAKRDRHRAVSCFPSSIDAVHFAGARAAANTEPADQAALPAGRKLGYFGVIDERMDLDLVARLADLRPDWQLVMIGPVVKIEASVLPRRPNIHWLGGKGYEELPAYLAGWDVGIMPFALNESTRFISPTKTPEFLAAGVPVVSTPIRDVVRGWGDQGLVEIASDAEGFAGAAERLDANAGPAWLARVDRHLATMSWDRTWREMQNLMERALWTRPADRRRTGSSEREERALRSEPEVVRV